MATDNVKALLHSKKILTLDVFKAGLLDYLREEIKRVLEFDYSLPAILSATVIPVAPTGNNRIDIGASGGPFKATTGIGYIVSFPSADDRLTSITIPPDAGVVYSVALEAVEVEANVEQNPRTGEYQYKYILESIGRKAAPDGVVVSGPSLTVTVDSVTEAGHDYSGRSVRVWLKSKDDGGPGPQTPLDVNAFQTATVSYVGGHNVVTVAAMGQTAPSTSASDYWVQLIGPTVRRKIVEDLTATTGAVFVAEVTSVAAASPIATISTTAQRLVGFTPADTADVFRRDTHGRVKVRVKADASDSAEPQLSVMGTDGLTKFQVDETGLATTASAHVTGAATVDGVLTAASEHVTGAATVDGALTAGSAHITGAAAVDGILSAASASVAGAVAAGSVAATGALTGASSSVSGTASAALVSASGNVQAGSQLIGASAHVTGSGQVDTDLSLGRVLKFTQSPDAQPTDGLSGGLPDPLYGPGTLSRLSVCKAWARIRPTGVGTAGANMIVDDGMNIDEAYVFGNTILINFTNAMEYDDSYVVNVTIDDFNWGGFNTFNADVTPYCVDRFQFLLRARDRYEIGASHWGTPSANPAAAYFNLGTSSGIALHITVFGRQ